MIYGEEEYGLYWHININTLGIRNKPLSSPVDSKIWKRLSYGSLVKW